MVVEKVIQSGAKLLEETYGSKAQAEAKKLWLYMKDLGETEFIRTLDDEVSERDRLRFEEAIGQRLKQVPLQYIFNYAYFWNRKFITEAGVLIPRFDSEFLVEQVLNSIKTKDAKILELGIGSGALATTIALENQTVFLTGTDVSTRALDLARRNSEKYHVEHRIDLIKSDGFQEISGKYDIIYSNPPYIPLEEYLALDAEVKDFEPKGALLAEVDGLAFYLKWIPESISYLKMGGSLCFEIGYNQGIRVKEIMERHGFIDVAVIEDFAGHDRVVVGSLPNEV